MLATRVELRSSTIEPIEANNIRSMPKLNRKCARSGKHPSTRPAMLTATLLAPALSLQARPRYAPVAMCAATTAAETFKAELMEQLSPIDRGFKASGPQRRSVNELLKKLARCESPPGMSIDGDWELAYTDAPDILTLNGGPLATLKRIGQQIDEGEKTIANVLEYTPASWLTSLASDTASDSLQQRVLLTYEVDGSRCGRVARQRTRRGTVVTSHAPSSRPPGTISRSLALASMLKRSQASTSRLRRRCGCKGRSRRPLGSSSCCTTTASCASSARSRATSV